MMILNNLDLIQGILYQICTQKPSLPRLKPSNRRSTLSTIMCLTGSHLNARLVAVVVGKLCKGQERIPRSSELYNTCAEHILKDLNSALGLSIHLRMKRCAQLNPRTQLTMYCPPKMRGELRTSIRNDKHGHTVKTDDLANVNLCQSLLTIGKYHRNEVR